MKIRGYLFYWDSGQHSKSKMPIRWTKLGKIFQNKSASIKKESTRRENVFIPTNLFQQIYTSEKNDINNGMY